MHDTRQATQAERDIAAYRKQLAFADIDANGMTDAQVALHFLAKRGAEMNQLQAQVDRMRAEEKEHQRVVRTSLRRTAENDRADWEKWVRKAFHDGYLRPLNILAYQASILPERPKKADLEHLRAAAPECLRMLAEAPNCSELRLIARQNDEVQRLRKLVVAVGQQLHAAHAGEDTAKCGCERTCACSGCELIRAMDDVEIEGNRRARRTPVRPRAAAPAAARAHRLRPHAPRLHRRHRRLRRRLQAGRRPVRGRAGGARTSEERQMQPDPGRGLAALPRPGREDPLPEALRRAAQGRAVTARRPRLTDCLSCARTRPHAAHGWCSPCYARWRDAGRPEDGPPPPWWRHAALDEIAVDRAVSRCTPDCDVPTLTTAERVAATALLTARGWSAPSIAARLRVTKRSIERYRARAAHTQAAAG